MKKDKNELEVKIFDLTVGKYPQMYDGLKKYDLHEFLPFVKQ